LVGARLATHGVLDQHRIAPRHAHRLGVDLEPLLLGELEYLDQPRRLLPEPVVAERADLAAGDAVALEHARAAAEARQQPAWASAPRHLLVDMREEHAGQVPDVLRLQEIELHESLDRALPGAVAVVHPPGDFALEVEGQAVLGTPGDRMQVATDRQHEAFGAAKARVLLGREQADVDQFGRAADAVNVLADPVERLQVAQAALAILDVGLDDVAAVAHAPVAGVALGELLGDELRLRAGDDVAPETPARFLVERLIAPQVAALEDRRADRQVGLGHPDHLVERAARVADLDAEIPQVIEHRLDRLLAQRRRPSRSDEGDVDVRMGRHFAAAIAADGDQRQPLGL